MKRDELIIEERINQVLEMLISGFSSYAIIQTVLNPKNKFNWNIGRRQIENYIRQAKEIFKNTAKNIDIDLELGKQIKRHESLYRKAIKAGDHRLAVQIMKELANLLNLQRKIDVPVPTNDTGEIVIK